MAEKDIALVAHLMRRAGVGASRAELEEYAKKDYAEIVEDLLHPERFPEVEEDVIVRYFNRIVAEESLGPMVASWFYRMINTKRPLQEKIALFWHHIFAAAWYKGEHPPSNLRQLQDFREDGLSSMRTILMNLAKDPLMIDWLDNSNNHNGEPNENWGRELLELFSMGIGNYTEDDIKNASRAFTGWTFRSTVPLYPYGQWPTWFEYHPEDHDDGEKTFLGETGRLNGEDIIDIIVKQPACARFISRHLYNFFVADEPQVPSWSIEPPRDVEAIETLVSTYFESGGEIRSMLRVLFNSDFFKEARFKRVKCPAELVAGTVKLAGTHQFPGPALGGLDSASGVMGQELLNPPTVEGWHTGHEWIDGGTLNERVNFAVGQLNDATIPGIQDIVNRLRSIGSSLTPEDFVDQCLDLAGPLDVSSATRAALLDNATSGGEVRFGTDADKEQSAARVSQMLQLIVSSPEYQFA